MASHEFYDSSCEMTPQEETQAGIIDRQFRDRMQREDAAQSLRIEALRAAARIVAGEYAGGDMSGGPDATIAMAEQFAAWLETGER